jgi:hypothetical protein
MTEEIMYEDLCKFIIAGDDVCLFSVDTDYGVHVAASVNNKYYHLGYDSITLDAAIHVWQELNNRILTDEELIQALDYNINESSRIK